MNPIGWYGRFHAQPRYCTRLYSRIGETNNARRALRSDMAAREIERKPFEIDCEALVCFALTGHVEYRDVG